MSRYYSFNDFMTDVIKEADTVCRRKDNMGLEDLYNVSFMTLLSTQNLISVGWYVFIAVVALIGLGWLGLIVSIPVFLTTPIGAIVLGVLGIGAVATIKTMYHDRALPEAVKAVGEEYKPKWESADGNNSKIDTLLKEGAASLYARAYNGAFEAHFLGALEHMNSW